jgi:ABC-type transport system involved in multi-copper enzyme maturation permease subunit
LLQEFNDFWQGSVTIARYQITGEDLVDSFGAGNPFAVATRIMRHMFDKHGSISDVILDLLRDYAIFHGVIIVGGLVWSVVRLRPLALAQGPGGETKRQRRGRRLPALGRRPMFWKEVFAEPGMRLHLVLRVLLVLIVLASFVPPVLFTASYLPELLYAPIEPDPGGRNYYQNPWTNYRESMSAWVVATGGVLGTVLLLMAAARAAGSITGERARHTLDDLLTSPLTNAEIVNAKWWGALLAQRRGLLWLGIVYCIGLCSGAVSIVGTLGYFLALIVYASFMTSLGLFFSASSRGTFRATLKTMIAALFFLGGHWLVSGLFCYLPLAIGHNHTDDLVDWLVPAQVGFTPPAILTMAPLIEPDKIQDTHEHIDRIVGFGVFGLCVFVIAGQLLRFGVIAKFAEVMNRTAVHKADGPLPKETITEAVATPAQPEKIVEPGTVSP